LQVSPAIADRDACIMEHNISEETFAQIEKWLQDKPVESDLPTPKA